MPSNMSAITRAASCYTYFVFTFFGFAFSTLHFGPGFSGPAFAVSPLKSKIVIGDYSSQKSRVNI